MSEVLIVGDIHAHSFPLFNRIYSDGYNERLLEVLKSLDWVRKLAVSTGITNVIFLGDLFETKHKVDTTVKSLTIQHLRRFISEGIHIHYNIGNHDKSDQEGRFHTVEFLKDIGTVYDKVSEVEIEGHTYVFVPYMEKRELVEDQLKQLYSIDPVGKTLILHQTLEGSVFTTGTSPKDVYPIDKNYLNKYQKVFCGHLHNSQVYDNVRYVGSLSSVDFSDADSSKHVEIYNPTTNSVKEIVNTISPIFKKYTEVDVDRLLDKDLSLFKSMNRHVYLDITCDSERAYDIRSTIKGYSNIFYQLKTITSKHVVKDRSGININMSNESIIKQYANTLNADEETIATGIAIYKEVVG